MKNILPLIATIGVLTACGPTASPTAAPSPTQPPATAAAPAKAAEPTLAPPTATRVPPTATSAPPTATAVPPTATAVPPSPTPTPTVAPSTAATATLPSDVRQAAILALTQLDKTYPRRITMTGPNNTTSVTEWQSADRIRASMRGGIGGPSELVVIGNDSYWRRNNGAWEATKGDEKAANEAREAASFLMEFGELVNVMKAPGMTVTPRGNETVAGVSARVIEFKDDRGAGKMWVNPANARVIKMELASDGLAFKHTMEYPANINIIAPVK